MQGMDDESSLSLKPYDFVFVRHYEEIKESLSPFNELKGCTFLDEMRQYCGTKQKVYSTVERFLDERDFRVKKSKRDCIIRWPVLPRNKSFWFLRPETLSVLEC